MERPTRRSATANGSVHSGGTNSSRRRRREAERETGGASDGGDTDSSAVETRPGKAKRGGARAARGKESHEDELDSEDPAQDDDARASADLMVKLAQSGRSGDHGDEDVAPAVVGYATRARRERSQSVVSTASDSASSVASARSRAEEEEEEDDDDSASVPRAELHVEKLAELEKKKKMVEDGTLAEYCRRVAEFKEERNRLLQSAEWHKNLQLKNTADLHGFEVQRAHHIWLDRKERLKSELVERADALLAKLRGELTTLHETKRLPTHVVAPKKSFVLPPRKASAKPTVPDATVSVSEKPDGETSAEATPRHSVDADEQANEEAVEADEDKEEAAVEGQAPETKRRKTLEGSAPVPSNVLRLPLDDISSDLASIMNAREAASTKIHTALPAARLELRVDRRRLLCGKYVFEEGDEVVVTAAVLKEDYIGVISSVSEEELYVKLSTGQKVRVAVDHIALRRCEIRPFLRGSAGIESLQSSGWVECEPF